MRARRWMNSDQCRARMAVCGDAPASTSGSMVAAGIFISTRTERIAVIRSITQPISASATVIVEAVVRRPRIERQHVVTRRPVLGGDAPQLFADEWHERMQEFQDFVERPRRSPARLGLGGAVGAGEHRLDQFEIPVAIDVPDKAIDRARRLVEFVSFDRRGDLPARLRGLVRDPAVERLLGVMRIEIRIVGAAVDLGKARRVPELGREIAVALDALRRQFDIAALRRHGREREAQGVGAVLVDHFQRVDDVAFRLRHLGAAGVAHQGVDVDVVERHFFLEVQSHHHHARDPEEDDVEAGDQR